MYPIQARPGRSSSGLNSILSVGGDDGAWYDSGWTDREVPSFSSKSCKRGFLPVIYFISNLISFRSNHHLCIYTNSRPYFWFSKRFVHRASPARLLLPRFRQMKPAPTGQWWVGGYLGLAWGCWVPETDDLAEGPGLNCGARLRSRSTDQVLEVTVSFPWEMREVPRRTAAVFLC